MRLDSFTEFDEVLARHLVVDAKRRPAERPVGLPLALHLAAGHRLLDQLIRSRIAIDDGPGVDLGFEDRHLEDGAGGPADRQEGRVGLAALLAEARQHDRHHLLIGREHREQRLVEGAGAVDLGGALELVGEAEAVEEATEPRIVVGAEAVVLAEGVGNSGQRLVEMPRHHLLVGDVVGHLAEPVHVVGEADQAGWHRIFGEDPERGSHHGGAGDLAEGADMRQPRWAVAGLEDDAAVGRTALDARDDLAGLLERPGIRPARCVEQCRRDVDRRRIDVSHSRSPGAKRADPKAKSARIEWSECRSLSNSSPIAQESPAGGV